MSTHIYKVINSSGSGGGSGDVEGPLASTDKAIARFNGTDGKVIQNSGIIVDDSNNILIPGEATVSGTAVKATLDNHEARLDDIETKYVLTFDATTSWGVPSGGMYTISIPQSTHLKGSTPNVRIEALIASDYVEVEVDELRMAISGNISIKVPSSPDARFEGRITIG